MMRRALGVSLLALLLCWPISAAAQQVRREDDQTIQQFFLPGTNTSGWRVHASRTAMGVVINDAVAAARGYKSFLAFSHNERISAAGVANVQMPIAGTTGRGLGAFTTGVTAQRMATTGSIIGIAIASSAVLTYGAAHAEATILNLTSGVVGATRFLVVIGAGLTNTQYATSTQARGVSPFSSDDAVGCRINTETNIAPETAELLCTLIIEH